MTDYTAVPRTESVVATDAPHGIVGKRGSRDGQSSDRGPVGWFSAGRSDVHRVTDANKRLGESIASNVSSFRENPEKRFKIKTIQVTLLTLTHVLMNADLRKCVSLTACFK
ncbi:hypothetical protein ROHU_025978 [Labeo rohita]|uniref:Uncharacterized protein n=1 Tax=Labeo rohita TaxID=84645 RepID=A0A498MCG9_LABRO|nr:hypothetical protein ROHU_032095 [Labeo rohita]RXN18838.1 hypothetical protein ROHU_025978 [Labeo rohita]